MIIGDGIMLGAGGESASIVVTAPTGSMVKCTTPSGIVLTATETSGTWTFAKLKVYGTYTVSASNGTKTVTKDILVDSAVEYTIKISYALWLYKDGDEFTDMTGGFTVNKVSVGASGTPYLTKSSTYMTVYTPKYSDCSLVMANTIDVSNYNSLYIEYTCSITNIGGCYADSIIEAGVIKKPSPALIDISSSSTLKGIIGWIANFYDGYFRIHKIWLE